MPFSIVTRASWGARHDRGAGPAPTPAAEVWLHHSVTPAPSHNPDAEVRAMRQLESIGEQRFGRGVSYTFAVMPSGRVYEGHGVDRRGAHTKGRNSVSRAVVLVGNYDTGEVPRAVVLAVAELLVEGKRRGWWRRARLNGGHQQAPGAQTACPGRHGMTAVGRINAAAAALERPKPRTPPAAVVRKAVAAARGYRYPLPGGRNYAEGDAGNGVRAVQERVGARPDGVWGPGTTAAVRAWQRRHKLTPDGVYGPATAQAMRALGGPVAAAA